MAHFHHCSEGTVSDNKASTLVFSINDDLVLDKIFGCGQCFRWSKQQDGSYMGATGGRAARVSIKEGALHIDGSTPDDRAFWRNYFDMDTDYAAIRQRVAVCDYMTKAADFGAGIRILKQNRWETLCSFIFSQCNNITRITGIIERFCDLYGRPIPFEGGVIFDFPSPETVAGLTEAQLAPLKSGYRAPYVIEAARQVADGRLDLDKLSRLPSQQAREKLKKLPGVGDKVANCVLLFGLEKREAFPVDVWIRRALKENFPLDFDPAVFGPYGGIAQQYIFYYARSKGSAEQ